jgi:hypothetical protein
MWTCLGLTKMYLFYLYSTETAPLGVGGATLQFEVISINYVAFWGAPIDILLATQLTPSGYTMSGPPTISEHHRSAFCPQISSTRNDHYHHPTHNALGCQRLEL